MRDAPFKAGDRVRVRSRYAPEYMQPFRRLIQMGRVATVMQVHGNRVAAIAFDVARKGAQRQDLRSVLIAWLERADA